MRKQILEEKKKMLDNYIEQEGEYERLCFDLSLQREKLQMKKNEVALNVSLGKTFAVDIDADEFLREIKVNTKGKADFTTVSGRAWTLLPGTELYQVPLWEQRDKFENPVTLKASGNTDFSATPVYTFRVTKERAVDVVFDNKQLGYGPEFVQSLQDNILEPKILDLMKEESRKYTTEELMAKGGSLAFEQKVQEIVKIEFQKAWLRTDDI